MRIARTLGRRPILQEQYCEELADFLEKGLADAGSKPLGIAVDVVGEHSCMGARGVRTFAPMVTSIMRGAFFDNVATRNEFYARTGGRR